MVGVACCRCYILRVISYKDLFTFLFFYGLYALG